MISVNWDQHANAKEADRIGFGKALPFHDVTLQSFNESIHDILDNPKYRKRAQEHGRLLKDQLSEPLEKAIWWMEFLVRHPDQNHFRSPIHDLTWYKLYCLDVALVALGMILSVVLAFSWVTWCVCCRKRRRREKTE